MSKFEWVRQTAASFRFYARAWPEQMLDPLSTCTLVASVRHSSLEFMEISAREGVQPRLCSSRHPERRPGSAAMQVKGRESLWDGTRSALLWTNGISCARRWMLLRCVRARVAKHGRLGLAHASCMQWIRGARFDSHLVGGLPSALFVGVVMRCDGHDRDYSSMRHG